MNKQKGIKENTVIVDLIAGEEVKGQLNLSDGAIEKCAAILVDRLTEFMKSGNDLTPKNVFGRASK